jgi:ribosomal protein S18 acetylase RimI-like enzyme
MSAAELGELLVASFAGYRYPPARDPPAAMTERLATEDLDLAASVVAIDDRGERAGLSLLALRGRDAWCGGFGLVPALRGRGLARAMMAEQARRAGEAGAERLRLEVLEGNEPALRAYRSVGFRRVRDLGLWRHDGGASGSREAIPEVPAAGAADALGVLAGVRHTWQREPATLRLAAHRPGVRGALWAGAAALWRPAPWGGTLALSVSAIDRAAARVALKALVGGLPGPITLFNEPVDTPVHNVLWVAGFMRYDGQHELSLEPLPVPAGGRRQVAKRS